MLVLSRKPGEAVVLGDQEITVTVLKTGKNHVRLGFVAPKKVQILRKELIDNPKAPLAKEGEREE